MSDQNYFHCDLWTGSGSCGRPAQWSPPSPPPTPVSFSNERTPLSAYVAAASCARALSASLYPLPPPNILTRAYFHSFTEYTVYALLLDIFQKKSCVSFVSGNIKKELGDNVIRVDQLLHFILIKLTILFYKS